VCAGELGALPSLKVPFYKAINALLRPFLKYPKILGV